MVKRIDVAVLGGTGTVGQKFISLLQDHPWFNLAEIGASPKSAGKKYSEAAHWRESSEIHQDIAKIIVKQCDESIKSKVIFSALDSAVAGEIETFYKGKGHYVFSNSKNHRMSEDSPILIPEINSAHTTMLKNEPNGFIATNANCTTTIMALALFPIHQKFQIEDISVTTMQALSGAGYPGPASVDIMNNVIPFIDGEEEKVESEIKKIFGKLSGKKIEMADINISASCNRVPVIDGHTISLSIRFKNCPTLEELQKAYLNFTSPVTDLNLPSNPKKLFKLFTDMNNRPQPKLDISFSKGMGVSIGRIRKCSILDFKLIAFGHNTIRGAAGGSILNAEYCKATNII